MILSESQGYKVLAVDAKACEVPVVGGDRGASARLSERVARSAGRSVAMVSSGVETLLLYVDSSEGPGYCSANEEDGEIGTGVNGVDVIPCQGRRTRLLIIVLSFCVVAFGPGLSAVFGAEGRAALLFLWEHLDRVRRPSPVLQQAPEQSVFQG